MHIKTKRIGLVLSVLFVAAACGKHNEKVEQPSFHSERLGLQNDVLEAGGGGGWIGGGGKIRKDSGNPWWVKNTKDVNFCVDIDEENFGVTRARAEEITISTLNTWKNELDLVSLYNYPGVGTQAFHLEPCSEATDLRVQFGVLTPEQQQEWPKNFSERPSQYLGIAVRTDYDAVNMRGKGFIYLSPQAGPFKLEVGRGQNPTPWAYGDGLLAQLVLLHELGHVFGYSHESLSFMSPELLEFLLSADLPKNNLTPPPKTSDVSLGSMFRVEKASRESCYGANDFKEGRRFWGLPEGQICLRAEVERSTKTLKIFISESVSAAWRLHGSGTAADLGTLGSAVSFLARLYLPPEQTVFEGTQSYLWMPGPVKEQAYVEFATVDNSLKRTLLVALSPDQGNHFSVSGVFDERVIPDVLSPWDF
jgi:hypothetical protein